MDERTAAREYRETARLLTDAAKGVTSTVARMHRAIARRPFRTAGPAAAPVETLHNGIADLVYGSVLTGLTAGGALAEVIADVAGRLKPAGSLQETPVGRTATGMIGGAFGHRPHHHAAAMTLRVDGAEVPLTRSDLDHAYPDPSGHVVLLVHGLIETERWWYRRGDDKRGRPRVDYGTRLAGDLDCTPVYLRYHSGLHISDNGRQLDELLTDLVRVWPVPIRRISIIGHSMGGLVARSAVHQAGARKAEWLGRPVQVVCLGTPHNGAPLEVAAHVAGWTLGKFAETAPLKDLLDLRSPGIKDLRYGYVHEHEWSGRDPDALFDRAERVRSDLPDGVRQHFLTVTIGRNRDGLLARLVGDALVTPTSAEDHSQVATRHWIGGLHHFHLLQHEEVYRQILVWLRDLDTLATRMDRP